MNRPIAVPAQARWPAVIALLTVGVADLLLPQRYRIGPPWLLLVVAIALSAPLLFLHSRGLHELSRRFGLVAVVAVNLAIIVNAVLLVVRLPGNQTSGTALLRDAALIWAGNVLAFALWYWELDGGGPGNRRLGSYRSTDFVFPQLQQDPDHAAERWLPEFVDYLFLAFNTSTAFSPTDTLILSRRAKALLMAQSLISLLTIGGLAARAINTL